MKILIVDDRPTNLKLLGFTLETEGHSVSYACDGVEALEVMHQQPVEAVISDVLMPNMDGFRLCMEVRKHPRFHALPFVIYTSTYSSSADHRLALDAGADCYLVKPAPDKVIFQTLAEAVEKARHRIQGPSTSAGEVEVIKQYNAALVTKLEERNIELETANASLRTSEERIRGTLESMLEGCQIIDHAWRYVYLNPTGAQHIRRTRAEILGGTLLDNLPGLAETETYAALQRSMIERVPERIETEIVYPDGSKAWLELSLQPVPEGLFILSLDITERRQARQQIDEQVEELLRWQEVILNREDRVQALKMEVNELLAGLGQPARYGKPTKS